MARRRLTRKAYQEEPEEFTQSDMFDGTGVDEGNLHALEDPAEQQVALFRQMRTLLATNVLNKLNENKHHNPSWQPYDFRILQLRAIRLVVDNQGLLDGGIHTAELVEKLSDWAGVMAPDRDPVEHEDVARDVVNWLLGDETSDPFNPAHIVYDAAGVPAWQSDYHVDILRSVQNPRGEIVLRASPEAINLILHVLGDDIADAQRAEERLLNDYIVRGRFDLAIGQARRALLRSKQYAEEIRGLLAQAQQDISQVDLPATREKYDKALTHIRERLDDEDEMACLIEKKEREAPSIKRLESSIVEVRRLIRQCYDGHTTLHGLLLKVGPALRREQEHQLFASSVSLRIGMRDILLRMLKDPLFDLSAKDGFFRAVVGPVAPPIMEIWQLADDLIAAGKEITPVVSEFEEPDLVDSGPITRFPPEAVLAARKTLASSLAAPRRLSELLRSARDFTPECPELAAELTRLLVLQEYAPERRDGEEVSGLLADFDDQVLQDPAYYGDDLLIGLEEPVQQFMVTSDGSEQANGQKEEELSGVRRTSK